MFDTECCLIFGWIFGQSLSLFILNFKCKCIAKGRIFLMLQMVYYFVIRSTKVIWLVKCGD